jgi:hypothetical protein
VSTPHEFGGVLGQGPLDTFVWALTFSVMGSWLVCEVAPYKLKRLGVAPESRVFVSIARLPMRGLSYYENNMQQQQQQQQ